MSCVVTSKLSVEAAPSRAQAYAGKVRRNHDIKGPGYTIVLTSSALALLCDQDVGHDRAR